jgi:hypothetical protein
VRALIFFVDFDKQENVARIFSSAKNGDTPPRINQPGHAPVFKHMAEEIWETRIPFSEKENQDYPLFLIVGTLGFAVFL